MADATAVSAFLAEFKSAAAKSGINFWKTKKNDAFLVETGCTYRDVEELIHTLTHRHYSGGPETDDNPGRIAGEVWKFSIEYCGYDLYMKLKLSGKAPTPSAECLSCHERELDMAEPLRPKRLGVKG